MLKTLSVSKVVYITFFDFPSPLTEEIQKNRSGVIWHSLRLKISLKTLSNNSENDELKQVRISSKLVTLRCLCLQNLYEEKFD